MAWAFVAQRGAYGDKVGGVTVWLNPSANLIVGAIIVIAASTDNEAGAEGETNTHTSASDDKGNTWTKVREQTRSPGGSAKDGVTSSVWISKITTEILTTDIVQVNLSFMTTARLIRLQEFSVGAGNTYSVAGRNGSQGAGTTPTVTLSGLASSEYLWLGALGWEGVVGDFSANDPDYSNGGGGATSGGNALSNIGHYLASRIFTGTSNTYNPTLGTSRDWTDILAAVQEVPPGTVYTENPRAAASGVSRLALQQTVTLAPKAASQSKAQVKLTLSYILDRRAPALAQQRPLLQSTYILSRPALASSRALSQILIPIVLTPRARATALAVPTLQSALTLAPRGDGRAQALSRLQWSAGLLPKANGSPRATTALQAVMDLSPRSLAIARALTQILIPIVLTPKAVGSALATLTLQEAISLTPRTRGQAQALPHLQQVLSLSLATRATTQAKAVAGLSYLILVQVTGQGMARVSPAQALSLAPHARAAAEAEVALQQALTLSLATRGISSALPLISGAYGLTLSARVRALALPGVGLLLVISPRVQVGTAAAMPPGQALTLTPTALARVLATVPMLAPPIVLTPVGLILARAIPSITTMDDILSARIAGLQEDIADLQAEVASLRAQTAAEWKI